MRFRHTLIVLVFSALFLFPVTAAADLIAGTYYHSGVWGTDALGTGPYGLGTTTYAYGTYDFGGEWTSNAVRVACLSDSGRITNPDGSGYREFVYLMSRTLSFTFADGNHYTSDQTGTLICRSLFGADGTYIGSADAISRFSGIVNEDHNSQTISETVNKPTWYVSFGDTPPDGWSGYVVGGDATGMTTINSVPVPGAIWLLGSGLLCLIGRRNRIHS